MTKNKGHIMFEFLFHRCTGADWNRDRWHSAADVFRAAQRAGRYWVGRSLARRAATHAV